MTKIHNSADGMKHRTFHKVCSKVGEFITKHPNVGALNNIFHIIMLFVLSLMKPFLYYICL